MNLILILYVGIIFVIDILIFFPPFFIVILRNPIEKIRGLPHVIILSIPFITILMMYLLPQAWAVFPFYSILLLALVMIAKKYDVEFKYSLPMAIFFIYAVSVLWELPIQYGIAENPNASILSLFKIAGVPLFFLWLHQRGWKINPMFVLNLFIVIIIGIILASNVNTEAMRNSYETTKILYWMVHSYRLFWIYLLGYELIGSLKHNVIYSTH